MQLGQSQPDYLNGVKHWLKVVEHWLPWLCAKFPRRRRCLFWFG